MVDFERLRTMGRDERDAVDAASRERFYSDDEVRRDAATRKRLLVTLAHEPELRTMPSGDRIVVLRGVEEGRDSPLTAVYAIPPRTVENEDREAAFDRKLRGLGGGDEVSLAGQWSKRGWNDSAGVRREAWEFKTQLFEQGSVPLDRMLENARADRLGVAPAVAADVAIAADSERAASRAPVRNISRPVGVDAGTGR